LFGNAYVTSTASLISPVHPFDDPFSAGEHPHERQSGPVQMIVSHGTVVQASAPYAERLNPVDDRAHHEATVISLFRLGAHTLESAARTLDLSASQFEKRLADLDQAVLTTA